MSAIHTNASIQRYLAERAEDAAGGIWLLLDRFLAPAMDMANFTERGYAPTMVPITHPAFTDEARRPVLIWIKAQDADLIAATVDAALAEQSDPVMEAAKGFCVAGWLEVDGEAAHIAWHLARAMEQRQPPAGTSRVLRLSDRRVLEYIWDVLNVRQKAALLGPVRAWHVIDRCNQLRTYAQQSAPRPSHQPESLRLLLDRAQWEHLKRCQQAQEMARGWRRFAQDLPPDYLRQINAALQAATGLGLNDSQDVLLLGAYIVQIHPLLATHPRVTELVRRSVQTNTPLSDVLGEVPDPEGWDVIKKELDSYHSTGRIHSSERTEGVHT